MKRKIISILLILCLVALLLPTAAFANGPELKMIYEVTEGEYNFSGSSTPIGAFITGTGSYELKNDLSDIPVIINNASVTVGTDGGVNAENLIICGDGRLTMSGITFTGTVEACSDDCSANDVVDVYGENAGASLHAEGSFAPEGEAETIVGSLTVSTGKTLSIGTGARLSVGGLTVEGTLSASQDAQLTVRAGASVSGVTFYDEMGKEEWTDFSHNETFNWLSNLNKWVRFAENGDPNAPGETEFWVDYDNRNDAKVERTGDSYVFPARWSRSFQKPENFNKQDQPYDTLSFTLVPPNDDGTYNPIVEIEVYDGHEDGSEPVPNTILSSAEGSSPITITNNEFTYTPTSDKGFVIHVFWSQQEYAFAHVSGMYVVEFCWEGNGTVSVSNNKGTPVTSGNRTKIGWEEDPGNVEFTVTPSSKGENALEAVWIEQEAKGKNDYNALTSGQTAFSTVDGYKLDISAFVEDGGGSFVNMAFRFTGWEPQGPGPEPQGPGENQYCLHYSNAGSVAGAASDAILNFTANESITWTLTYPQNVTKLYRVEINVYGEPGDRFEYNDGDTMHNSDKITVSGNTISYTPTSADPFEVFIYWTEQDRFNQFGYNPDEEVQLQCRVLGGQMYGTSIDNAPWCSVHDEQTGWDSMKINVPQNTESFTITFANNDGYEFDKAVFNDAQDSALQVSTTEGIAYTWAAADFSKELNVYFKQSGEPSPGTNPQEPQGGVDWESLEEALEGYIFAYGGSTLTAEQAKALVCEELSERHIGEGLDYALGEALGKNAEGLAGYIDVQGDSQNSGAAFAANSGNKVNKPYYSMEIRIEDVDPDTEENQTFSVQTNVYVLDTVRDIIIESVKGSATQYQIVTLLDEEFGTTCEYIDADSIVGVCGNAAMCNGIEGGGEGVLAWHMTQEHAGGINTFPIGARLVLTLKQDTVKVTCNSDAAPWSFINVGVYSGSGTESDPVEATVFVGTDSVTLGAATGSKTITAVEPVGLPASAIEFNAGTLYFRTAYDNVEVKITYDDETSSYMVFNRVGLHLDKADVDTGNTKTFGLMHGTDHSVRYSSTAGKVVIGTFYYADETVIDLDKMSGTTPEEKKTAFDAAVAEHYAALDRVDLFVTITYANGTKTQKVIKATDAITMSGTATNNNGFEPDDRNTVGYAGQGSNHFYDDFVLWSGSEADFANIKSVSAIAYNAGSGDSFGGIRVGSGTGVTWTNN